MRPSARAVRAVLCGYGYWGARLLTIAGRVDELNVVGVVEPRMAHPDFVPPAVPCWPTLARALATTDAEAVVITVPAVKHFAVIREALQDGRHVFVEKPLTTSADDARELAGQAQAMGLVLAVDHQYWWSDELPVASSALASGRIGTPCAVVAERAAPGPRRSDVSAMWDRGCHDVSILLRLGLIRPGPGAVTVDSRVEVPDGAVAGCVTVSGRTGQDQTLRLHACWLSPVTVRRMVVTGTEGSLLLIESDQDVQAHLVTDDGGTEVLSRSPKGSRGTPVERALHDFARSVLSGEHPPRAWDAADVVEVVEAIDRQAHSTVLTMAAGRCWTESPHWTCPSGSRTACGRPDGGR